MAAWFHPRGLRLSLALVTAMTAGLVAQQPAAPGSPIPGSPVPGATAPGGTAPQMPARDRRPGETPRGTAVIRGMVVAAETGTPLRRVQVRVMPQGAGNAAMAQTDAEGRFEVKDLAAGRYQITAARSGYATVQFGQRATGQPGTPIEVSEGQVIEKVNIALPRGGAISGRIVDELGEPVAGVQVVAQRFGFVGGTRRLMMTGPEGGMDRTDDLGQFRLYGLSTGEYYVSATLRSMDFMPINVISTPGSAEGFTPTYFPGTSNVSEARRVTVRAGQDVPNLSFALVPARLGRISGRVTTSAGEPFNGMLMAIPRSDTSVGIPSMMPTQVRPDGTFQTAGLAPGSYTLMAQDRNPMNENAEVGRVEVRVDGEDVNDVFIVTGRGGILRGRIVTEDGVAPAFKPAQVRIFLAPADPTRMAAFGFRPPTVKDDWTFEATGIVDAVRLNVTVDVPGGSWVARHAWKDSVDLLDTGIDVSPGQMLEDVEVVITERRTELSGQIADDRGQPVTDAWVVVFSEDRNRWTSGSRYVRPTRPDTNGKYTVRLTPHDAYRVIVVRGLEDGQWSDPEFLSRALEYATAFGLRDGETRVINLRLAEIK